VFSGSLLVAAPPQPGSDKYDWMQFKNGEWLKGEIKDLQDKDFSFDSDELDLLSIDLDDVHTVLSPNFNTCVLEDKTVLIGTVQIVGDQVTVVTKEGEQHLSRSELRAIIPGGLSERDYWSLKFSLGLTAREGNTNQTDFSSMLFIERRTPGSRTRLDYNGAYSSVQAAETVNNHHATFRHNIYMTRALSVVLPSVDYYRDKFQNIDTRLTPGIGLEYDLMERSAIEWSVGAGYGYQHTRFFTVEADRDPTEGAHVALAGTDLNWDLTKKLEFDFSYKLSAGLESGSSTDHSILAVFSLDVWRDLDFDVSVTWDHVGNPQTREDGSVPDRNDVRTFVGIGWEF
jgi:putative salt-induced outer membrane protein YdiY